MVQELEAKVAAGEYGEAAEEIRRNLEYPGMGDMLSCRRPCMQDS